VAAVDLSPEFFAAVRGQLSVLVGGAEEQPAGSPAPQSLGA
jgi:hypothetical protein